jgi:CBS domain-containing protein
MGAAHGWASGIRVRRRDGKARMAAPIPLADAGPMLDTPPLDLDRIRVADCMHHGIVSCDAAASLAEVAATMCAHRVHALAVAGRESGIVSDADVIAAVNQAPTCTAGEIAATEWLSISAARSLQDAARMMTEHGVTHLLVRDARTAHVTGVISSTDIMCAMGRSASGDLA